jgi:hypothetical protein
MGGTSQFGDILSTAEILPWLIDIDVFMTAIAHTNWDTIWMDSSNVHAAQKESSGAQNDEINFDVVLAPGTWTVELMHNKWTSRGIYTLSLDVTGTLGTIDGYNGSTVYNARNSITGIAVAAAGKQRLKLKMATKNAASGSYQGSINGLKLKRTA